MKVFGEFGDFLLLLKAKRCNKKGMIQSNENIYVKKEKRIMNVKKIYLGIFIDTLGDFGGNRTCRCKRDKGRRIICKSGGINGCRFRQNIVWKE